MGHLIGCLSTRCEHFSFIAGGKYVPPHLRAGGDRRADNFQQSHGGPPPNSYRGMVYSFGNVIINCTHSLLLIINFSVSEFKIQIKINFLCHFLRKEILCKCVQWPSDVFRN